MENYILTLRCDDRPGIVRAPEQLVAISRDVERLVLARAVRLYAEDRVVLAGARTVVFG
jgi:formyltetrahydrofolate deformylase